MIINRRNFVQSSACVVAAAPVFANLLLLSPSAQTDRSLVTEPTTERDAAVGITANDVLFRIYGWDNCHGSGNRSQPISAGPISKAFDDGRATIRVMQSWRTAWR
jgi:hypothetical protein